MAVPLPDSLLTAPVTPALVRLARPMMVGIGLALLFNLVETLFVARLGARELAAQSFTFPVVFILMNLCMGLGVGASSVVARALGEGDRDCVKRLATGGLVLAVLLVLGTAAAGLFLLRPTFRLLGAPPDLLPLIESYMVPWYSGIVLLAIPMLSNGVIRATGDTVHPSVIMGVSGLVNVLLDPLLIFGWGPVPGFGLQGAAFASVLSWAVVVPGSLWVLGRREQLLEWRGWTFERLLACFRAVLHVGAPAVITNMWVPVCGGIITRILSEHGENAVAAYGVGQRLESMSMIGIFALSTAVSPIVGQSYGAGRMARIVLGWRAACRLTLSWSLIVALLFGVFGSLMARWFSDDARVVALVTRFVEIVPLSFGFVGVSIMIKTIWNSMGLPLHAAALIAIRLFVFTVPLAYVGSRFGGVIGTFAGIALGNTLTGALAWAAGRQLDKQLGRGVRPSGNPRARTDG